MYNNQLTQLSSGQLSVIRPSISEQLTQRKINLESELQQVNEAISVLTENPDLAKVIETIAKARFY